MKETATEVRIDLAADVLFDFDKAELKPQARQALTQVATIIREKARGAVRIEGHTDGKGSAEYNQALSQRRAEAVRQYLVQRFNIDAARIEAIGHGKNRLKVADNPLDAANRRVQIVNQGEAVAQLPPTKPKR